MEIDIERARREEMRWLILRALYAAQPLGTSEVIIRNALEPIIPDATELEIRKEIDYLEERGLAKAERNRPVWLAKINRYGIDVVEYTVDCKPGIARPNKW
jgi:hypothetical protein